MSAELIDGRAAAAELRARVAEDAAAFAAVHGRPPGLATVLVGADEASAVYVGAKQRACAEAGIRGFDHRLDAGVAPAEVEALVDALAADDAVDGILCQLPVPAPHDGDALTERIPPAKDVDGLTVQSAGRLALGLPGLRPCTPSGVLDLLDRHGVDLVGSRAVVVGRSNLFGKPMAQLLLRRHATVTIAHSRTRDLAQVTRTADVLVVAAGVADVVGSDGVRPGAVVIDVGIHRTPDGLRGDVAAGVADVAGAITPVPGGVGPMTIARLLANAVQAATARAGGADATATPGRS